MNFTSSQQQIIEDYCSNDMRKLKRICYPKIRKACGDSNMDEDDMYSISMDILMKVVKRYDESLGDLDNLLSSCIQKRINTYIRDTKYRSKRSNVQRDDEGNPVHISNIPLDTPDEDGIGLWEKVASDFNIENSLSEESGFLFEENVDNYMQTLSGKQKKIAQLFIQGYTREEVKEKLDFTEEQFKRHLSFMQKPERRRLLKQKYNINVGEDNQMQTQTREKSKDTQYSISSLIKKIDGYTFRFDHPTQRESGRWTLKMKGNLISDILQNNPLPHLIFAEQIIDGVAITWNLDGKQKSTNAYDFYYDKFKVCKDVRRWEIEYQTKIVDKSGKVMLNNNLPIFETKTFDIRGKRFKDLPEELQERFCDYTFQCTQYLNCTDEDIEYHICRYNEGVRLNGSEKGMGEIGTRYAALIKEIASMPFFTERGGYKVSEFNNGTINRVIAESIMAINFLEDWKKKPEEMCSFMKDKVNEETFENFTDIVERLERVITDDVCDMFDSKDSFLYFGLFARFIKTGLEDKRFVEFMAEFNSNQSLHTKKVKGTTYKSLCIDESGKSRGTKDKYIVIPKIELLENLMFDFLHI